MIVRRIGLRPSGRTPASAATASAQAPAALTRTGALQRFAAVGRDAPAGADRLDRRDASAGQDLAARLADGAGEVLEHGVGVEPEAVGIEEAGDRILAAGAERREQAAHLGLADGPDRVGVGGHVAASVSSVGSISPVAKNKAALRRQSTPSPASRK